MDQTETFMSDATSQFIDCILPIFIDGEALEKLPNQVEKAAGY